MIAVVICLSMISTMAKDCPSSKGKRSDEYLFGQITDLKGEFVKKPKVGEDLLFTLEYVNNNKKERYPLPGWDITVLLPGEASAQLITGRGGGINLLPIHPGDLFVSWQDPYARESDTLKLEIHGSEPEEPEFVNGTALGAPTEGTVPESNETVRLVYVTALRSLFRKILSIITFRRIK